MAIDLKALINPMSAEDRLAFAAKCEVSLGHLLNVMYGQRTCATDLAVHIERESGLRVRRWDLRPDDWHKHWPDLIGAADAPAIPAQVAEGA